MSIGEAWKTYAHELGLAGYGWGMWANTGSDSLHPGAVGYLDSFGNWIRLDQDCILDASVSRGGVSYFNGPVKSSTTHVRRVKDDGGAYVTHSLMSIFKTDQTKTSQCCD